MHSTSVDNTEVPAVKVSYVKERINQPSDKIMMVWAFRSYFHLSSSFPFSLLKFSCSPISHFRSDD